MPADDKVVIGQTHGSNDAEAVLIGYLLGVEAQRTLARIGYVPTSTKVESPVKGVKLKSLDAATLPPLTSDPPIWRRPIDAATPEEIEQVRDGREDWRLEHTSLIARAATPLDVRIASALKDDVEYLAPSDDSVVPVRPPVEVAWAV